MRRTWARLMLLIGKQQCESFDEDDRLATIDVLEK